MRHGAVRHTVWARGSESAGRLPQNTKPGALEPNLNRLMGNDFATVALFLPILQALDNQVNTNRPIRAHPGRPGAAKLEVSWFKR